MEERLYIVDGGSKAMITSAGILTHRRYIFILPSALFASSIAILYLLGCFSPKADGFFSLYPYSQQHKQKQLNIPIVQLLSASAFATAPAYSRIRQSRAFSSHFSSKFSRGSNNKLEQELARARASIRKAALIPSLSVIDRNNEILSSAAIYRNPREFLQSHKEMEKTFRVYVYQEGEPPVVHDGPCKDIYSSEGRFIHEMEHGSNRFKTRNAQMAHVYFMPISITLMVKFLMTPPEYNISRLKESVSDYINFISTKHPFWNRTQGADHFMLSCHDWGPLATEGNAFLYNTSIRVLCNANSSEGFNAQKDVSLPEIHLYGGVVNPKLVRPPPSNVSRPYLAFFAGGMHGSIRQILFQYWKGKDPDLRVYEYLPKKDDYYSSLLQSRFCLCPSGYEVASPRIVEAVYAECIPVILSDHYVLPFSDVLRWEAFSIQVQVSHIPKLKEILMAVPEDEYLRLKEGLRAVRRHFVLNQPVKRYDMFHMILHSIWLRRLNIKV